MPAYAIHYHIHEDDTAGARRDSLLEQIRQCERVWEELPGLALVRTVEPLDVLEKRLFHLSRIFLHKDRLLVIKVTGEEAIARGSYKYLFSLRAVLPTVSVIGQD